MILFEQQKRAVSFLHEIGRTNEFVQHKSRPVLNFRSDFSE